MNWQDKIYNGLVESKSTTSLERAERRIAGASPQHRALASQAVSKRGSFDVTTGKPVQGPRTKAQRFASKVRVPARLEPEGETHRVAAVIAKTSKKKS
jgi:hypothetical protein